MKLLRYGPKGKEKPGILDKAGKIRDLSKVIPDITGETISPKGLAKLKKLKLEIPAAGARHPAHRRLRGKFAEIRGHRPQLFRPCG